MSRGSRRKGEVQQKNIVPAIQFGLQNICRYELWLAGKDLGHHPCDDEKAVAPSVAPPPSADEFLVNKTNKDREVPAVFLIIP